MSKITCNVVKDLMPLYVDDVLSEDSKEVVQEHLKTCEPCSAYHEMMASVAEEAAGEVAAGSFQEDKQRFQNLKRRLNLRRLVAIGITAILVACGFGFAFYEFTMNESYMTYEESGLYVENDTLKTKNGYYCSYGFESPDPEVEFLYLTTTPYQKHRAEANPIEVMHMGDADSGDAYKKIYYLTEEDAKLLSKDSHRSNDTDRFWQEGEPGAATEEEATANYIKANAEKIAELEKNSTLVWEAK